MGSSATARKSGYCENEGSDFAALTIRTGGRQALALFITLLVVVAVVGGCCALRYWFDRMPDAREHGTSEEELRHSEQVTGAVIQSGTGGFNRT